LQTVHLTSYVCKVFGLISARLLVIMTKVFSGFLCLLQVNYGMLY